MGVGIMKQFSFCWYISKSENICDDLSLSNLWANIFIRDCKMSCKMSTCTVISVGEGGTQGDTDGSFAKRCIVNDCVFRAKNVWKGWSFITAFKFDFSQLH